MKIRLLLLLFFVSISLANAQVRKITGTVADKDDNLPLGGVTVSIKGLNAKATQTDSLGVFAISIPDNQTVATLIFSFVGYDKFEYLLKSTDRNIQIQLKPTAGSMEDVVVIGFGQNQRKIAQTGALATITTKDLKQSPAANLSNALAGRLPGLTAIQRSGEPGASGSALYIRGLATLNNSTPLLTIDGIPRTIGDIDRLDPNEVASVTILKDASATSLYGVKGANGVIIITTKRGATGVPKISASVERSLQNPTRLPDYVDAYDYALLKNEAYKNDNPTGTSLPYSATAIEAYRSGSDPYLYPNVNWLDEALQNASQLRANFNISGGTPVIRYFINTGYVDQGGLYKAEKNEQYDPNSRYKRYNFRSNLDVDFNKNFNVQLSLSAAIENSTYPLTSTGSIFSTLTRNPFNAMPVKYPTGVYAGNGIYNNPIWQINNTGYSENFNSELSGNFQVAHKLNFITDGLTIKGQFSFYGYYTHAFSRSQSKLQANYRGVGDLNDSSNYNSIGQESPLSSPSNSFNQNRNTFLAVSLNYEKQFGDHNITGLLLTQRTQDIRSGSIPFVLQGAVFRGAYNFKNKYFAELNMGYNGTDQFAKGKRYGLFPAVSAGWVISNEKWFSGKEDGSFINFLKLRASYGLTGNDQMNSNRRWLYVQEWNGAGGASYGDPLVGIGGYEEGALANADVTWEKSKKANIGLELKTFSNKLSFTVDLFQENRNDILTTRGSVPTLIGMPSNSLPPANIGSVVNRGVESVLEFNNKIGSDFNYFVKVNGAFARNKILYADEENRQYDYLYRTGKRIGQHFGYTVLGFFKDQAEINASPSQFGTLIPGDVKYKDLNGDNKIDANDKGPMGTSGIPEFTYGFSGGLNYKGFDFSFLVQGAANVDVELYGEAGYEFFNGANILEWHKNRWTPATATTATYPVLHYGGSANTQQTSTIFLRDASYTRLKNVELGYTIKSPFITKIGLDNFRVYVNGQNLVTFDKLDDFGVDPEAPSGRGAAYPQIKIYNVGLSVNF